MCVFIEIAMRANVKNYRAQQMQFDTKFMFSWLRESNVMMGFASYTRLDWCKLTDNRAF